MKNICYNCLINAEKKIDSDEWKKEKTELKYWYEWFAAEKDFLKETFRKKNPKSILEIGAGSGRIIKIALDYSNAKITSTEKDKSTFLLLKKRFNQNNRLTLINTDKIPKKKEKFDIALCMMNTAGNQSNPTLFLKKILGVSNKIIFTVSKKGTEKTKERIMRLNGHNDFKLKGNCFYFNDGWVKGLKSKLFSKKDILKICKKLDCKIKIIDLCKMAYLVKLEKTGNDFEISKKLSQKSLLTEKDVKILSAKVNKEMGRHAKKLLNIRF